MDALIALVRVGRVPHALICRCACIRWPCRPHRLDSADGRRLLALRCQLVWATTWMAEANNLVAPRLGLPQLPVVEFPEEDEPERGLHWKTTFLTRWAARRTFVWLDDEITDTDRRWVQARYPGKALLHRVDPFVGLTDADFTQIRQWLAA
jgi:hypothetical protein